MSSQFVGNGPQTLDRTYIPTNPTQIVVDLVQASLQAFGIFVKQGQVIGEGENLVATAVSLNSSDCQVDRQVEKDTSQWAALFNPTQDWDGVGTRVIGQNPRRATCIHICDQGAKGIPDASRLEDILDGTVGDRPEIIRDIQPGCIEIFLLVTGVVEAFL
ncbi:hypothetical protein AVEN_243802-1 [Araneus ventricosus]|uniref:Uncharacterized protein n=1 Tax=Araneus ventricosus TaxID=182803 RepID=A0A4Y2A5K6_ARAVE|nr:hypothetical protein AVEN_243802-1 [Araneus ventricosus]